MIQHDAAMLSLKRIKLKDQDPLLTCGFTNGTIRIYQVKANGLTLLRSEAQVHGFGVNCMDTVVIDDAKFMIVTGGDD